MKHCFNQLVAHVPNAAVQEKLTKALSEKYPAIGFEYERTGLAVWTTGKGTTSAHLAILQVWADGFITALEEVSS